MTPTPDDLRAYREGRLELARFEEVDRWLAAQSAEEQARILTGDNQDDTEVMAVLSMPASVTQADDGALEFLNTFLVAFFNADMDAHSIARMERGDLRINFAFNGF